MQTQSRTQEFGTDRHGQTKMQWGHKNNDIEDKGYIVDLPCLFFWKTIVMNIHGMIQTKTVPVVIY